MIAFRHFLNEFGNVDAHRAAADAGMILAVQAALGFVDRRFGGIAQGHFLKISAALVGGLGGHGILLHCHIGHVISPS
jgi:hypothetical protein